MQERFETFTILVNRISRNIRKIKNQEMAEYQLKSVHVSCLYYLYLSDGLTATELCEHCEEDKATISRAIDYLERQGYLSCDSKNRKRYKSSLLLTAKGREAGKKIAEKITLVLEEVSIAFTREERENFYRYLCGISEGLEKIAGSGTQKGEELL